MLDNFFTNYGSKFGVCREDVGGENALKVSKCKSIMKKFQKHWEYEMVKTRKKKGTNPELFPVDDGNDDQITQGAQPLAVQGPSRKASAEAMPVRLSQRNRIRRERTDENCMLGGGESGPEADGDENTQGEQVAVVDEAGPSNWASDEGRSAKRGRRKAYSDDDYLPDEEEEQDE